MAIQDTIKRLLPQVDRTLRANGLYGSFSYTDTVVQEETYNPETGEYEASTPTVYTFDAVPLEQRGPALSENSYSVMMDIIAIPINITFELRVDQQFVYDGNTWTVDSFKTAPQNGVYEIVLGRK